jgi:hypothetical protein
VTPLGTPENPAVKEKVRGVAAPRNRFSGATQMVNDGNQDTRRRPANQGVCKVTPEPNKIGASTPYDFEAKNLTAYGGLLPVATMLEKLGFQQLLEETLTVKRKTKAAAARLRAAVGIAQRPC